MGGRIQTMKIMKCSEENKLNPQGGGGVSESNGRITCSIAYGGRHRGTRLKPNIVNMHIYVERQA